MAQPDRALIEEVTLPLFREGHSTRVGISGVISGASSRRSRAVRHAGRAWPRSRVSSPPTRATPSRPRRSGCASRSGRSSTRSWTPPRQERLDPTVDRDDLFDMILGTVLACTFVPTVSERRRPIERVVELVLRMLRPVEG